MDKRIEENIRVKRQIVTAFLELLEKCGSTDDAEKITISKITARANVSRMAYYRNFHSKKEIIDYYLKETLWPLLFDHWNPENNFWTLEYGIRFYTLMRDHKDQILTLDKCGYSGFILEAFNQANEDIAGDMPFNSIDRFRIYYAAGASYNAVIIWLKEGCIESPEEMAAGFQSFCRLLEL